MKEVLLDAALDSLELLPFLFVVYVFIEVIEKQLMFAERANRLLTGKFAPAIGVGLGLIPQCGFSVMSANLYLAGKITLGTLLAVFISTSDEAIPILLSNADTVAKILPILGIKLVLALFIGYFVNIIFKDAKFGSLFPSDKKIPIEEEAFGCCHHPLVKDRTVSRRDLAKTYLLHPLIHSLKIFLYIFVINIIFGSLVFYVGRDKIAVFLAESGLWQPFVAGLIGLIPTCASSVIITQLYALGGLTFGSCVAGLSVNAGIGMAVIFRQCSIKESLFILCMTYLPSVFAGVLLTPLNI